MAAKERKKNWGFSPLGDVARQHTTKTTTSSISGYRCCPRPASLTEPGAKAQDFWNVHAVINGRSFTNAIPSINPSLSGAAQREQYVRHLALALPELAIWYSPRQVAIPAGTPLRHPGHGPNTSPRMGHARVLDRPYRRIHVRHAPSSTRVAASRGLCGARGRDTSSSHRRPSHATLSMRWRARMDQRCPGAASPLRCSACWRNGSSARKRCEYAWTLTLPTWPAASAADMEQSI
jgi:hypothetical protein